MADRLVSDRLRGHCLFNVKSKKRLAEIIYSSTSAFGKLLSCDDQYSCWEVEKSSGGVRKIEAPYENLKRIQKRIALLLHKIELPDYVMAPRKGFSYVSNANVHIGSRCFRLLDIEDFFPSCTQKRVFWFFNTCMKCSPDVSGILANICCREGRLPQGSPCSPILAFLSYIDMWEEINSTVQGAACKLSLYADDITISGTMVPEHAVWEIKKILFKSGHSYNKKKERSLINSKAEITGAIVTETELLLPNRQHKKLSELRTALSVEKHPKNKEKLLRQLRGREAQKKQVTCHR